MMMMKMDDDDGGCGWDEKVWAFWLCSDGV